MSQSKPVYRHLRHHKSHGLLLPAKLTSKQSKNQRPPSGSTSKPNSASSSTTGLHLLNTSISHTWWRIRLSSKEALGRRCWNEAINVLTKMECRCFWWLPRLDICCIGVWGGKTSRPRCSWSWRTKWSMLRTATRGGEILPFIIC